MEYDKRGTRKAIKAQAKASLSGHYGTALGATILYGIVFGAMCTTIVGAIFALPMMCGFLSLTISLFYNEDCKGASFFARGFSDGNLGRKIGGNLWMTLFTILWGFVPIMNIIKPFAYSMTPYILGDCLNVKGKDAIKLSMRMMKGHKWELFVFYLSFLGWALLDGITFGLVGLFYYKEFKWIAKAGFYEAVKADALNRGVITEAELNGLVYEAAPILEEAAPAEE